MRHLIIELLSYSILIPAILSSAKLKNYEGSFTPFFLFIWLGVLSEIISTILIYAHHSNALISNVYVLAECLLLTWLFKNWNLFVKTKRFFYFLLIGFTIVWLLENFVFFSINRFNSYFRIIYSFSLVLMSISQINILLLSNNNTIINNSVFLACIAFIIFFTYKAILEIFWLYGLNGSSQFRSRVYEIMAYINLITNLIYGLAFLWIRRKREYILQ
jgi:hypothetical protein